mmetsp:Transcript_17814/g.58960  ORF Transcript_17814/g.58960 Transcript_17814/m.58960 type:complete len:668 (+) Transcript_17814:184-2187(+)
MHMHMHMPAPPLAPRAARSPSRHHDDAERGERAGPRLRAVGEEHCVSRLDEPHRARQLEAIGKAAVLVALLARVRVVEGDAATMQVERRADVHLAREHHDRAARPALRDEARRVARARERENEARAVQVRRLDNRVGDRFRGRQRVLAQKVEVRRQLLVVDGRLRLLAHEVHHGDRLARVRALGRLARQHHAVGAVEHRVGDVGRLGARRARVARHRLKHLCRADAGLARDVALCDHHLLREEHLLRRDLDAQVAARHHDAVGGGENLVKVAHPLVVLYLGDDSDPLADHRVGGDEARAHLVHVRRLADEGGEHHVHVLGDGEGEVVPVLGRQRRQVHIHLRQVAPLLGAEQPRVDHLALERARRRVDRRHLERDEPVVDEDHAADRHHLGQVRVVHVDLARRARVLLARVRRDEEPRPLLEHHAVAARRHPRPDLGTLGVERDGEQPTVERLRRDRCARIVDHLAVVLVRAVRKVHPHDVHAGAAQHRELLDGLGLRADGADDARRAQPRRLRVDVELAAMAVRRGGVLRGILPASVSRRRLEPLGRDQGAALRRREAAQLLELLGHHAHQALCRLAHADFDHPEAGQGGDTRAPAPRDDDRVALLAEAVRKGELDPKVDPLLDVVTALGLWLRVVEGERAAVQVQRRANVRVAADRHNGASRPVL